MMKVALPVTPDHVEKFLNAWKNRYVTALTQVKEKLSNDRKTSDSLGAVYNIYSRGDLQGGSEIKSPRKIRLKANQYAGSRKDPHYNFLDMPDIVGLTISVLFPSDIQSVVRHIDELIQTVWWPAYVKRTGRRKATAKKGPISGQVRAETIYGEIHEDEAEGYYACHFYVRLAEGEPIVEIQVKTVLHDAWGRKTHDLSYKNQVRIGKVVKDQFASLGQMIARVDLQSDFLRTQITFDNIALERKKRLLQLHSMYHDIARNGEDDKPMMRIVAELKALGASEPISLPRDRWKDIYENACKMFKRNPGNSCQLLALLGALTNNPQVKMEALERILMWEAALHDNDDVVKPKLFYHLAHHTFGDTPNAIDEAELAVKYIQGMRDIDEKATDRRLRRLNSLYNSLAYYHAEIIGTDQGEKRESHLQTRKHLEACVDDLVARGVIVSKDQIWSFSIADLETFPAPAYPPLDTSLFVKIKLATKPNQVMNALEIMGALKEKTPPEYAEIAAKALNLHQHHAYHKLLELEAVDAAERLK